MTYADGKQRKYKGDATSGAVFSKCEKYRYILWRIWDVQRPLLVFFMLNPSTADERKNDATIARCIQRAHDGNFGGIEIINLFALRATYPEDLYHAPDPIGPENDAVIEECVAGKHTVVCAWGGHGVLKSRAATVGAKLRKLGVNTSALMLTKHGAPSHPLRLPYSAKPFAWSPP